MNSEVNDEIEALRSIYMEDFEVFNNIWDKQTCLKFRVYPTSLAPEERSCKANVLITLNKNYPKIVPKIDIKDVSGLNSEEEAELKKVLNATAKSSIGEVMCYSIITAASEFLESHNKNPAKAVGSLYEAGQNRQLREAAVLKEFLVQEDSESLHNVKDQQPTNNLSIVTSDDRKANEYGEIDHSALQERMTLRGTGVGDRGVSVSSEAENDDWLKSLISRQKVLSYEDDKYDHLFDDEEDVDDGRVRHDRPFAESRYKKEFQELEVLGKGGGGQVCKVRNNLDRRYYAVKKILLDSKNRPMNRKIIREVTTISRLLHKNIVRYYAAWIEESRQEPVVVKGSSDTLLSSEDVTPVTNTARETNIIKKAIDADPFAKNYVFNGNDFNFQDEESSSESGSDERSSNESSNDEEDSLSISEESSSDEDEKVEALRRNSGAGWGEFEYLENDEKDENTLDDESSSDKDEFEANLPQKILYIQMEFCDATLRQAIDGGKLWQNSNEVIRLFCQILDAIVYIHGKGLLHRDLKPANIFLDAEGNIKIGDFGLATTYDRKAPLRLTLSDDAGFQEDVGNKYLNRSDSLSNSHLSDFSESLTGGIGTAMYRAPEQESTVEFSQNKQKAYDSKVDMYSLGIILFEMCHHPFSTGMERISILKDLRSPSMTLPEYFTSRVSDKLVQIIKWLVQTDPSKRPSALELQNSPLLPPRIALDKNYLAEFLNALSTPNSETLYTVLGDLFEKKSSNSMISPARGLYCDVQYLSKLSKMLRLDHSQSPRHRVSSSNDTTNEVALSKPPKRSNTSPNMLSTIQNFPLNSYQVYQAMLSSFEMIMKRRGASFLSTAPLNVEDTKIAESIHVVREISTNHLLQNIHSSSSSSWTIGSKLVKIARFAQHGSDPEHVSTSMEFIDKNGFVVHMNSNLVLPYAKYVAKLGITDARRYAVEKVFTESFERRGGVQISKNMMNVELVFDIIGNIRAEDKDENKQQGASNKYRDAFLECEVINTAVNLVMSWDPRNAVGQKVIRFGHKALGNVILDLCAAPHPRDNIYNVLSALTDEIMALGCSSEKRNEAALKELHSQTLKQIATLDLPADVFRALKPFLKVLCSTTNAQQTLTQLRSTFIEHEVISAMRKQVLQSLAERSDESVNDLIKADGDVSVDLTNWTLTKKELKRYRGLLREFDEAYNSLFLTITLFNRISAVTNKIGGDGFIDQDHAKNPVMYLDLAIESFQRQSPYSSGNFFQIESLVLLPNKSSNKKGSEQFPNLIDASFHILCYGGHFEEVIESFRPSSTSSKQTKTTSSVIAVGLRTSVDRLHEFLMSSLALSPAYANDRLKIPRDLARLSNVPSVLVVTLLEFDRMESQLTKYSQKEKKSDFDIFNRKPTSYLQLAHILSILRKLGISATDSLDQLLISKKPVFEIKTTTSNQNESIDLSNTLYGYCAYFGVSYILCLSQTNADITELSPDGIFVKIRLVEIPLTSRPVDIVAVSSLTEYFADYNSSTPSNISSKKSRAKSSTGKLDLSPTAGDEKVTKTDVTFANPMPNESSFVVIDSKIQSVKDKKSGKDNELLVKYKKKVNGYIEEVFGASLSTIKKLNIIVVDLPYLKVRMLCTYITSICEDYDASKTEFQNFLIVDANKKFKRGFRSVLESLGEMNVNPTGVNAGSGGGGKAAVLNALIYSSLDDRADIISFSASTVVKFLQFTKSVGAEKLAK